MLQLHIAISILDYLAIPHMELKVKHERIFHERKTGS